MNSLKLSLPVFTLYYKMEEAQHTNCRFANPSYQERGSGRCHC